MPVLQVYLKDISEYKFGIRLIRLLNFMVIHLQIGLHHLMEFMSNSIESEDWVKRIMFELYNTLFTNPEIVSQILQDKELVGHLEICLICLQKFLETNKFSIQKAPPLTSRAPIRLLDPRNTDTEKPDLKIPDITPLSIDTTTSLIEILCNLLYPNGLNTSEILSEKSSDIEESPYTIPFSVSKLILRILSILLEKASKDIDIQALLNGFQVYIHMAGMRRMRKERDVFIRELCGF